MRTSVQNRIRFGRGQRSRGRAFTILELLITLLCVGAIVVVGYFAFRPKRALPSKVGCAESIRRWGVAILAYSGDHNNNYPDNSQGLDCSWLSPSMTNFWEVYLSPKKLGVQEDDNWRRNTLFCPTDEYHRLFTGSSVVNNQKRQLLGYFYLPGRSEQDPNVKAIARNDTEDWFLRKNFHGEYSKAPILMDRIQAHGPDHTDSIHASGLNWQNKVNGQTVPASSHPGSSGVPDGANYLFEDGHAEWIVSKKISLGAFNGKDWLNFFKPDGY